MSKIRQTANRPVTTTGRRQGRTVREALGRGEKFQNQAIPDRGDGYPRGAQVVSLDWSSNRVTLTDDEVQRLIGRKIPFVDGLK